MFGRKNRLDPGAPMPVENTTDPATPPEGTRAGLFPVIAKILPIGKILEGLFSVLKDSNGKISSKRAGAGALVVAGIAFLGDRATFWPGVVCLVAAVAMFTLTKLGR